ncbi:MAG TPA: type II toxin-antitoxin system VapC family toxin [Thermoanaerobaculia bacterium]|nr:type II toxin-antitoxin system VapC family toxin [Thermoanaerobaculia bacterium]
MAEVLVDSNVLLDVVTEDPRWFAWSSEALARCAEEATLVVNPIIFAEVSIGFDRIEEVDELLEEVVERAPLPWEAAFLAGKAFVRYRKLGGRGSSTLPDFYIGAHAAVAGMALLTRDAARYRTYFPGVRVIAPRPK